MKKITKIVGFLPIVLVVFFAFFAISPQVPIFGTYRFFSVSSGSMEPKIGKGSLILVKKLDSYPAGTIITYRIPNSKNTVTHRVIETPLSFDGKTMYRTKGDANQSADTELVSGEAVVGGLVLTIPLLGYPIAFSKTLPGLVILIVIPATIIAYSELLRIKEEVQKIIDSRKKKKNEEMPEEIKDSPKKNLKKNK